MTTCGKGNSLSRLPERENSPGDVPGPRPSLTEEEVLILRLVAEGQTIQEIADELGVFYSTARRRLESIMDKLMDRPFDPLTPKEFIVFPENALLIVEERLREQQAEGVRMPEGMPLDELALRILIAAETGTSPA